MRLVLLLTLGLIAIQSGPAFAQEANVRETRCWVGNITFSAGAGISAGDGVAVCNAGTGWVAAKADTPVAGCLLDGKISSSGAIVGVRNNDSVLLQCDPSGRWIKMDVAAKE